jgi:hypothetical protein
MTIATMQAIAQRTGVSPVAIVSILWGYDLRWYSSRKTSAPDINFEPRLMDLGTMTCSRRTDNRSTTGSISFTLDDSDGALKFYIDNVLIEKAKASVWLWFEGTSFNDRMLLLDGHLTSPAWEDDNRSISLTLETAIEKQEFGFSPTQEDFKDLSPDAQGITWPILFGTVVYAPAVKVRRKPQGLLLTDVRLIGKGFSAIAFLPVADKNVKVQSYLPDGTYVKDRIYIDGAENFPLGKQIIISINNVYFKGAMQLLGDDRVFIVEQANYPKYQNVKLAAINWTDVGELPTDSVDAKTNGNQYSRVIQLADPKISLSNTFCYFRIKDKFAFNYCTRQIGNKCFFRWPFIDPVSGEPTLLDTAKSAVIAEVYSVAQNGMVDPEIERRHYSLTLTGTDYAAAELSAASSVASTAFWRAEVNSVAEIYDPNDGDIFILSSVKLNSISGIFGKKTIKLPNGKSKKLLTPIPKDYYQLDLASNYKLNNEYVSGLVMFTPLTEYQGQEWEDIVYASGTSSVGPNAVDIIKHILQNFTDLNLDGSFSGVHAKVNDYPCNFAYYDRRNALQIAQEIAYQSRCVLVVDSDVVSIRFLGEAPNPIMTFNETNIEGNSVQIKYTETQEIITRSVGTWTETYKDSPQPQNLNISAVRNLSKVLKSLLPDTYREQTATKMYTYRENIDVFGLTSQETNIFIYDNESSVKKTVDFWGHRNANSWTLLTFKPLGLDALILQPYDGVSITINTAPMFINTIGTVESINYDQKNKQVEITCWLPIKAGEQFTDTQAYG